MTFLITCPNCGPREALEFAFGGETTRRAGPTATDRELAASLYFRRNVDGWQTEWWVHQSGCRAWFLAERHTTTNEITHAPYRPEEPRGRARVSERLPERLGEAIRRDRPIRFRFERRTISAFEGDTVGSALAAAGVTITSRSFKYHRPRGLHCMTGSCPNCLMQIDGIPNVRACTEPVREGMRVERQNAWPSVDRDVHGWLNTLSFMMPPGFYYKVFQRPRWAWPFVEPFIRSKAGLGTVPHEPDHRRRRRINLHPDVLVIGAGAAGLAAAAEAAKAGATVVLLEQGREAGGHLLGDADVGLRSGLARQVDRLGCSLPPEHRRVRGVRRQAGGGRGARRPVSDPGDST